MKKVIFIGHGKNPKLLNAIKALKRQGITVTSIDNLPPPVPFADKSKPNEGKRNADT